MDVKIKHLNGDFLLLPTANVQREDILYLFKHKKKKSLSFEDFVKNFVNCSKERLEALVAELVKDSIIVDNENGAKLSLA